MVSAKHTPGPWEAYESSERCPFPVGVPVEVGTTVSRGAKSGTVCEMVAQGEDGKYSADTTAANAHLIAAAPDLLEACRHAAQFIENGVAFGYISLPEYPSDPAHETLPLLRAAIAKAEGRDR